MTLLIDISVGGVVLMAFATGDLVTIPDTQRYIIWYWL